MDVILVHLAYMLWLVYFGYVITWNMSEYK